MVIGLFGFARSGKSTVAEYLEKEHGFKRVNFKDALVAEMKENFPDLLKQIGEDYGEWKTEDRYVAMTIDELFDNKPPLMRALMQNYGTNVRRKDKPDYWIKQWLKTIKQTKGNIVVDDVRFFNELSAIIELEGVTIRVKKDDVTSGGTHQSETEQELFCPDFTLNGVAGSHESLYKELEEVLDTMRTNVD